MATVLQWLDKAYKYIKPDNRLPRPAKLAKVDQGQEKVNLKVSKFSKEAITTKSVHETV